MNADIGHYDATSACYLRQAPKTPNSALLPSPKCSFTLECTDEPMCSPFWADNVCPYIAFGSVASLARIFHRVSTAGAQSGMSTALRLFGRHDILSNSLALPTRQLRVATVGSIQSLLASAPSLQNGMKYTGYPSGNPKKKTLLLVSRVCARTR